MFAQKFSRNKVELRVRCLPRPLCLPPPSPLYALQKDFSNSVRHSRRICLCAQQKKTPRKATKKVGKLQKKKQKFLQTFLHFILLPPRPRSRYSFRSKPPPSYHQKHQLATPLAATAYCCHAFSFYRYRKRSWESFRFHNRILINFRKPNYKVLL